MKFMASTTAISTLSSPVSCSSAIFWSLRKNSEKVNQDYSTYVKKFTILLSFRIFMVKESHA
mgnify:CR=1 FL=1